MNITPATVSTHKVSAFRLLAVNVIEWVICLPPGRHLDPDNICRLVSCRLILFWPKDTRLRWALHGATLHGNAGLALGVQQEVLSVNWKNARLPGRACDFSILWLQVISRLDSRHSQIVSHVRNHFEISHESGRLIGSACPTHVGRHETLD